MKVSDYMKDRIGILLVNCAGIYALSLFLLMLGDQRAAVLLIDFAWLLVLACVLVIDYYQKSSISTISSVYWISWIDLIFSRSWHLLEDMWRIRFITSFCVAQTNR